MNLRKSVSQLKGTPIAGVFFDIDDTFSTEGKIEAEAYRALWALKEAGKIVVPVTGRPAGWCDHIARMWPVDAVIGENGAFYFMIKNGKFVKEYMADQKMREDSKERLAMVRDRVLREVPGTALASDQAYREFDVAIDFCEDVPPLPESEIDRIVAICVENGMTTKVSSIHVNFWVGDYTKLSMTKRFAAQELNVDLDCDNSQYAFCGDSPNDEPMFAYFKNSVGVANVLDFEHRLKAFPTYITTKRCGAGFAELVAAII